MYLGRFGMLRDAFRIQFEAIRDGEKCRHGNLCLGGGLTFSPRNVKTPMGGVLIFLDRPLRNLLHFYLFCFLRAPSFENVLLLLKQKAAAPREARRSRKNKRYFFRKME